MSGPINWRATLRWRPDGADSAGPLITLQQFILLPTRMHGRTILSRHSFEGSPSASGRALGAGICSVSTTLGSAS
jgi:hypothetical protein